MDFRCGFLDCHECPNNVHRVCQNASQMVGKLESECDQLAAELALANNRAWEAEEALSAAQERIKAMEKQVNNPPQYRVVG